MRGSGGWKVRGIGGLVIYIIETMFVGTGVLFDLR